MFSLLKEKEKSAKEILSRSRKIQKKRRIGRAIIWLTILLVIVGLVIYSLTSKTLAIKGIVVQGNSVLETAQISAKAEEVLAGNYGYFFPKRSIFIYPKKQLADELMMSFPRIKQVEIGLSDWTSVLISVSERSTDSVWCEKTLSSTSTSSEDTASKCYFSDADGFIFAESPIFLGSVFVELNGLLGPEPLSTRPLASSTYRVVSRFSRYLPEIFNKTAYEEFRLMRVEVSSTTFSALIADASRPTGEWRVLFDGEDSADRLAENLYSALSSSAFKKEMIDHKGELQSIDLRYGNKVFYKFNN